MGRKASKTKNDTKKKVATSKKSELKEKKPRKKYKKREKKEKISKNDINEKNRKKTISEELVKVTNVKSREQIKKPQQILYMVLFYAVIITSLSIFIFIKFSKSDIITNEQLMEENIIEETIETTVTKENNNYEEYVKSESKRNEEIAKILERYERSKKGYEETEEDEIEEENDDIESSENEIDEEETIETYEETTEKREEKETINETKEVEESSIKETTKKKTEETKNTEKETEKVEEETSTSTEGKTSQNTSGDGELPVMNKISNANSKTSDISKYLPLYGGVIYSRATFYQFSNEENQLINEKFNSLTEDLEGKIFGDVDLETKGKNGILYLNSNNIKSFLANQSSKDKEEYNKLPQAPYYSYIKNSKFGYDALAKTNNLQMEFDFSKAVDKGLYYSIPTTVHEPAKAKTTNNGLKEMDIYVLKNSKVGFSNKFELTSTLEILDIEYNTKKNPYFNIEDVVGSNPNVYTIYKNSDFNIKDMIKTTRFNYIIYDRKGYVTDIFYIP